MVIMSIEQLNGIYIWGLIFMLSILIFIFYLATAFLAFVLYYVPSDPPKLTQEQIELAEVTVLNDVHKVEEFLKKGVDPDTIYNGIPLIHMIYTKKEILSVFLKYGANINIKNSLGETILHKLPYYYTNELLKFYIENGADINTRSTSGIFTASMTPLHVASKAGKHMCVKGLLDNGADPSLKTDNGETAKMIAVKNMHANVLEVFNNFQNGCK